MSSLAPRSWVPQASDSYVQRLAAAARQQDSDQLEAELLRLTAENKAIHEQDCINLNPATNAMNPKAEALLAAGLGSRPSLGYPGDKYEMGLEAAEKIEVIANALAAEIFGARYVEVRVGSGALANLYVFMAAAKPGDTIIVPPPEIGGHVTHQQPGAAGLYGLKIVTAPVDAGRYTVDLVGLREQARALKPKVISIGGSLNLLPHPVAQIREIADEVGAKVLFDAAHLSGLIAGQAWQQPLAEGAHVMTMSTYKSLGGPPSGLIVGSDPELAQRLDAIAYPGLTANFDLGKTAALAMTLLDWRDHGRAYGKAMVDCAALLAEELARAGLAPYRTVEGYTRSHQCALPAAPWGGGQAAAKLLRRANLLTCGIGLPIAAVEGDVNGLRLGTTELPRWGMGPAEMPAIAGFLARVLAKGEAPEQVAPEVTAFRKRFTRLHYVR